jgi:Rad3-related DNA helicase
MEPVDLGLPAKFAQFRRGQSDTALGIACADKRFYLLSAPTGSGKSIIYMAVARLLDTRTLVLTSTKGLQAQLNRDFASIGLTDIRGQNNYRCVAVDAGGELSAFGVPGTMCDEGPCRIGVQCAFKPTQGNEDQAGCLYYDAVRRAREARLVVTNYAYWMTNNKYADPAALGEFGLLILDEAHAAPDELADFCAVRIDRDELRQLTGMSLPPLDESASTWVNWAITALEEVKVRYMAARRDLTAIGADRRRAARAVKRLTDLGKRLKALSEAHKWRRGEPSHPDVWMPGMQTDWVAEETRTGAVFSPVWAHAYAEEYLFKSVPRVVMVSAVLQRAAARYLGVAPDALEFSEMGSTFDPARRPLIYVPTTRVDRRMTEGQVRIWLNRIDDIIDGRLDRKGIIHTRSYDRAKAIMERSRHSPIMIAHTTRTAREAIERFKRASAPCVLVSPSVEEGYDFPMDECRYQILAKVPFVDTRSAVIRARARSDKTYLNYLTALSVIQQTGRGMRAEDDLCESLMIDDHWVWWKRAARDMFPKWFRAAWRDSARVPEAPRLR